MEKVINNADKVAERVNKMFLEGHGVEAIADDGNVCVQISGTVAAVIMAARSICDKFGHLRIGDGAQEGEIWINGETADIHAEVREVASMLTPNEQ